MQPATLVSPMIRVCQHVILRSNFRAVRAAWNGVTELFPNGEPDHDTFFNQDAQYIDSCPVSLPPLTGEVLRDEFLRVKESKPGLDGWCHADFKILSQCAPWTIDYFCEILQLVEQHGVWPSSVISGYAPLIPKSEFFEQPTDLRPLTVLSVLYWIWARIRARQLNGHWQELFAHDGMWGGWLMLRKILRQPLLVLIQQVLALTTQKLSTESHVNFLHVFLTRWVCLLQFTEAFRTASTSDWLVGPLTKLEKRRATNWIKTVKRARHLPVSWDQRCACLSHTRFQYTWGTGTHKLPETKEHENDLVKPRSALMRCLLRRDHYQSNPTLYFSLLASPSLNPFFCHVMDGLTLIWRGIWKTRMVGTFRILFNSPALSTMDGPIARLRQVDQLPEFRGGVRNMFQRNEHEIGAWLHYVRDIRRAEQWKKFSRDRPSFRGIESGICRVETLQYLRQLEDAGRDRDGITPAMAQARMRAAVMGLLLTGGLMTQDVVTRHRNQQTTNCNCSTAGPQFIEHASWYCPHHQQKRVVLQLLMS